MIIIRISQPRSNRPVDEPDIAPLLAPLIQSSSRIRSKKPLRIPSRRLLRIQS
jgi:hypothetical protein